MSKRADEVMVGVFFDGQDTRKEKPNYYISLADAQSHNRCDTGHFVNHGKDVLLHQRKSPEVADNRLILSGGSMEDSWQRKYSAGYIVWQMPGMIEA